MAVQNNFPVLRPSLNLDFSNTKSLDPRITFARASSATYFDSFGVLRTAAANVARFDHDPVTGESLGLLIEEQRTNLLLRSEEFGNAAWTKTRASIVANTVVAPDGALTGGKLIPTAVSGDHFTAQQVAGNRNVTYSVTVYAKAAEFSVLRVHLISVGAASNRVSARFNLLNGTFSSVANGGDASEATATITLVGNGWYRCNVSGIPSTTNAGTATESLFSVINNAGDETFTGDGASGIYIWGAQLETGAFPASYIKTEASQVTRQADVATMTGANFSSWYRQGEGTLFAVFSVPNAGATVLHSGVFGLSDGTGANRLGLRKGNVSTGMSHIVVAANVAQVQFNPLASFPGLHKTSLAYRMDDFASSTNGASALVDTSGSVPAVTQAEIGFAQAAGYLNGHIRRLAYYPRRLTNAQLQALTS